MFINEIRKIPFFRLIIPFILGIIYKINYPFHFKYLSVALLTIIVFTFFFGYYYNRQLDYHKRWVMGFLVNVSLFFMGIMVTFIQTQNNNQFSESNTFIGRLIEPVKETKKSIKIILEITEYQTGSTWKSCTEKVIVYAKKDSLSKLLKYGDLITFKTSFKAIKNSGNPDEFDYKKYLANKNIHFQTYLNTENWKLIANNQGNIVYATAYKLRKKLLEVYKANNISGDEFAILAALTLGVKDYLSPEIMQSYSTSGAMHILAVSGLHVGIIYIILNSMLFFMHKNKLLKYIQAIILIISIWFFAFITGLSPSVTRASIMLSFIIVGNASRRHPSVFNSIAISAFLILLIKPLAILHVGFQLSYAAVIAIVYFQPKIYRLLNPKNIILDKAWALTAVSIAAQIGTFPISIFYFHKFPTYFFITNLVAIPAAYIIIVLAVGILVFNFLPLISDIVAFFLEWTITILNFSTKWIENLPIASINHISYSFIETLTMYLLIISIAILIFNQNKRWLIYSFTLVLFFLVSQNIRRINSLEKSMFIVFNSKSTPVIGIKDHQDFSIITDSTFTKNKKSTRYLLDNLLTDKFIKDTAILRSDIIEEPTKYQNSESFFFQDYYIQYKNMKVVLLNNEKYNEMESSTKLKTNIVVLSKGFSSNIEQINKLFEYDMLVLDATIPFWQEKTILKNCAALNINVHNVREVGAYVREW
ncbi:MAG: ComEC/Rec2 family competence protein [Bacteroidota bacterium]